MVIIMDLITECKILAIIDVIADRDGDISSFPSLKRIKEYDGDDPTILKIKIYALEKGVI